MGNIQMRHGVSTDDTLTVIGCFGVLASEVTQLFFPGSSAMDLVGAEIRAGMNRQLVKQLKSVNWYPLLHMVLRKIEDAPRTAARFLEDPARAIAEVIEVFAAAARSGPT